MYEDRTNTRCIWPGEAALIILDEFHKYRRWKQHLKGEYDNLNEIYRFMVTGREVDFLVTADGKPWFAVEAKLSGLSKTDILLQNHLYGVSLQG